MNLELEFNEIIKPGKRESEYLDFYNQIIESARKRKKLDYSIYTEVHHIIPRCLGGTDENTNLITLTALEHITAHILLYRGHPNNRKLTIAADCMLGLVSPSTQHREEEIAKLDPVIVAELRQQCANLRKVSVVCFEKISLESGEGSIKILRIFDSITSAKKEGFSSGLSNAIKNGGLSGGYYWNYYSNIEEDYPDELQTYLSNVESGIIETIIKPKSFNKKKNDLVVCFTDDEIIRLYKLIQDSILDGFSNSSISRCLHFPEEGIVHKGYKWKYLNDYLLEEVDSQDKYNKYLKLELDNKLPKINIKSPNLQLICHDADNNIFKIYESLRSVIKDGFNNTKICKYFNESNSTTVFSGGYYWTKLEDWTDKPALEKYKESINNGHEPTINAKCSDHDGIQVIKCSLENDEIIDIYKSLHGIVEYSFKSISKVIAKPINEREYKGFIWYRLSEYIDKYPDRKDYIQKVLELVEPEENTSIKILLTISRHKLISVNDLYKARIGYTSGGKPYPIIYKNPKAKEIGEEIRNQLMAVNFNGFIPWLRRTKKYKVSYNFVLKSGISSRDVENLTKEVSDDITRFIHDDLGIDHFDDSEFIEESIVKSIIPGASNEYIYVVLRESYYNPDVTVIQKPQKLFLGGQFFPNIDWKSKLKNIIDKENRLSYYDPSEDIWNKRVRSIEKYEKCDTILYTLTPGDITNDLECEIINECQNNYFYNDNQFIIVAILGTQEDWESDFDRVERIKTLTNVESSKVRFGFFENLDDLYKYLTNFK